MELVPRVRQILQILLEQEDALPVKNLAEQIQVSKRTIQRELEYIGYPLKKYNLALRTKTGSGIWLEGEKEDKEALRQLLSGQEELDLDDRKERRIRLMLELLKDQTPKKLYYYGNLFGVSEATISKDMEKIEFWFHQYHLEIIRKQGFGVMLTGNERDYRVALREFISKYMDTPSIKRIYEEGEISVVHSVGTRNIKNIYSLLDDQILRRTAVCFSSIPDERIKKLTEESYISLVLHVTIALERVAKGEIIDKDEALTRELKQDEDFNLALLIVNSLEEEFELEIPDIEIVYICLHIKGAKRQNMEPELLNTGVYAETGALALMVREMIVAYDENLASILESDDEFVNGLAAHMKPTLIRLKNQMPIENPHLQEIQESYPKIYSKCKRVGKYMEAVLACEIPETELGFLAIHFGAAMVRLEDEKEWRRVVDIGVVCASGIGISRLMASRLKRFLKNRANVVTYGNGELTPYILQKNDFFVSSLQINEGSGADFLHVSPLLPEEDLLKIEEKVAQYEGTSKKREDHSDFARQLEKVNRLSATIKELLRNFSCIPLPKEADFQELLCLVTERITPYRENQIRLAQDISKREEIATQVIPELSMALLHARSQGILKPCLYVAVPEQGECFEDPYLQSIRAAVVMLIPEDDQKQENSALLGYLSEKMVEEETFLKAILDGQEETIHGYLTELLQQYFNQYLDRV